MGGGRREGGVEAGGRTKVVLSKGTGREEAERKGGGSKGEGREGM